MKKPHISGCNNREALQKHPPIEVTIPDGKRLEAIHFLSQTVRDLARALADSKVQFTIQNCEITANKNGSGIHVKTVAN